MRRIITSWLRKERARTIFGKFPILWAIKRSWEYGLDDINIHIMYRENPYDRLLECLKTPASPGMTMWALWYLDERRQEIRSCDDHMPTRAQDIEATQPEADSVFLIGIITLEHFEGRDVINIFTGHKDLYALGYLVDQANGLR